MARHVVFLILALICNSEANAFQRIIEDFEGVAPTWTIRGSSAGFNVRNHSRTSQTKKSGKQSELVHYRSSNSSNAKLVHPIQQAQVIHDFCPTIALKSTRDRIRFSVRVVLPQTQNPLGPGPLTLLVKLSESEKIGVWETLGAKEGDIVAAMRRELRSIQHQYADLKIFESDAYCDLLILDGFERVAGEAKLWIDSLAIGGFLPAEVDVETEKQNRTELQFAQKVEVRGSTLTVDGKPLFLRAIKHHGESMAFVKRLGFNAVLMQQVPTESQLADARQYHVWILCPAPFSNSKILNSKNANMIFAWNIGENFTATEIDNVKDVVQRIRQVDDSLKRPTFCMAHFPTKKYGKIVSFLRLSQLTYGTPFSLDQFEDFLASKSMLDRPFITDIQTTLPHEVMNQAKLAGGESVSPWLSFDQIQQLVFRAVKQGSRGLVFDSPKNLEQTDRRHSSIVNRLTRINAELMQVAPWLSGGTLRQFNPSRGRNSSRHVAAFSGDQWVQDSVVLELDRSQMVWVSHHNRRRDRNPKPLFISTNQKSPRVRRVTSNGISSIHQKLVNGRIAVELVGDEKMEVLIASEDSIAFKYVQDSIQTFPHQGILALRLEILKSEQDGLQSLLEKLSRKGIRNPIVYSALQESAKSLILGDRFVRENQPSSALATIIKLQRQIDEVKTAISEKLLPDQKVLTSAFTSDFKLLENSIAASEFMAQATWSENRLKESSFLNVQELAKSGWKQNLNESGGIQAGVRLVETDFKDGIRPVMAITAWHSNGQNVQADVTPIWLSSPQFDIQKKQFFRIEGWIKIDRKIENSHDGFMIIDSVGGPILAHREYETNGWKKFTIERITANDSGLQLVFALTGTGKVELAGLSIKATKECFTVK